MNILIHPAQGPVQHVNYHAVEENGGYSQPIPSRYPGAITVEFPDALPAITKEHSL
jgi:hypothetical protein